MLNHDRIGVSGGSDINKTGTSKQCDICHYWYFSDKRYLLFQKFIMSITVILSPKLAKSRQ